jgi:hypothetical protein
VSILVSHALQGMQEGLPVWSSKPGMDDLTIWASNPLVEGFVGLDLKTRRGRFSGLGIKTITCRCDLSRPQNQGVADRRIRGGISKLVLR